MTTIADSPIQAAMLAEAVGEEITDDDGDILSWSWKKNKHPLKINFYYDLHAEEDEESPGTWGLWNRDQSIFEGSFEELINILKDPAFRAKWGIPPLK